MSIFLTLAYLFFIGSTLGWVLELLFRNLTHKPEKLVNPGFCTGPWLPIYGFGLCVLFLLMLIYLSFAAAWALEPHFGMPLAMCIVAGCYLVLLLLFIIFRKQWIERPLVRFLAGLLLSK